MKVTINRNGFNIDYTKEELENLKGDVICKDFEMAFNHLNHKVNKFAEIQIAQIEQNSSIQAKILEHQLTLHTKVTEMMSKNMLNFEKFKEDLQAFMDKDSDD